MLLTVVGCAHFRRAQKASGVGVGGGGGGGGGGGACMIIIMQTHCSRKSSALALVRYAMSLYCTAYE